jgi:hypothetical protein
MITEQSIKNYFSIIDVKEVFRGLPLSKLKRRKGKNYSLMEIIEWDNRINNLLVQE